MSLRPIYFDTETTGTKPQVDRLVEIAAYDPVRDKTFERLINPQMPIPEEVIAIHNITDEMVKDAPTFEKVAEEFIAFCEGEVALVAHNNEAFDKPFLEAEMSRCQLSIHSEWIYIDTLKWSRKYRKDLPKHNLQYLRKVYNFPANNAHRALDDVITLARVFEAMIGDLTFEQIYKLLQEEKLLERMPFGKHQGKKLQEIPKDYFAWLHKNNVFEKPENQLLKESIKKLGILEKIS